ncbi:MAG: hypothetical protein GY928_05065, partial [Colwellia sp.]|nr:hypothetical protein [Colwellia sp.]
QLAELFKRKKCYTIEQLSQRLNYSLISIRRFLKVIGYYTSFTHNSKWYTLRSIPSFDKNGIWFYQDIGFCKHGNLNQTIGHFIDKSFQGLTAKDLFNILSVPCHPVLNQMYKNEKIDRYNTPKGFVYLSVSESKKRLQLKRLQVLTPPKKIERLNPQTAVYVLVEFIKNPKASFFELSIAVEKKGVKASSQAVAQLFKDYDLKKTPP